MKELFTFGHDISGKLVTRKVVFHEEKAISLGTGFCATSKKIVSRKVVPSSTLDEVQRTIIQSLDASPEPENTTSILSGTGVDEKGDIVIRKIQLADVQPEPSLADYIRRHLAKNSEQD